jgi:GH35 family endo-1,4-beta-xylanase
MAMPYRVYLSLLTREREMISGIFKKLEGVTSSSGFIVLFSILTAVAVKAGPIAEGYSKFLGNITGGTPASNFADYWNQITLENGGKWDAVESRQGSFNWGPTDASYKYCREKGFPFKHHCFVWGNQQPGWVNSGNARTAVENYIKTFGERYPEAEYIDVVNEPLHAPAGYREGLGGNGSTGWDWVITVFELARKYCPKSKLILNDYGIVNDTRQTANYIKIIKLLQERDLIDVIGVQSHYFNLENVPVATIKGNLDELAKTGLPITSSEFDLRGDETTQLNRYKTYFPIFWEHPAVIGVTLWGYTNNWGGAIIMQGGREFEALKWLRTYVNSFEKTMVSAPETFENRLSSSAAGITIHNRTIHLSLPSAQEVSLTVFDPTGRAVYRAPGIATGREITVQWPGESISKGTYIAVARGKRLRVVQKFIQ